MRVDFLPPLASDARIAANIYRRRRRRRALWLDKSVQTDNKQLGAFTTLHAPKNILLASLNQKQVV